MNPPTLRSAEDTGHSTWCTLYRRGQQDNVHDVWFVPFVSAHLKSPTALGQCPNCDTCENANGSPEAFQIHTALIFMTTIRISLRLVLIAVNTLTPHIFHYKLSLVRFACDSPPYASTIAWFVAVTGHTSIPKRHRSGYTVHMAAIQMVCGKQKARIKRQSQV